MAVSQKYQILKITNQYTEANNFSLLKSIQLTFILYTTKCQKYQIFHLKILK